ncbi:Aste57867_1392 [Aphanomyces stellatus]|uniref:Aste57867_1392 protein n=1 Tax=Aphanomyces stellatus TaxID=120398 RepID=A0A485K9B0_9STRA|nr:hypothetical protein As57867_001391 [Aphanomyces stellatus]VFT78609.1 Aste57867_1392 [Aphanomyces stellatus]
MHRLLVPGLVTFSSSERFEGGRPSSLQADAVAARFAENGHDIQKQSTSGVRPDGYAECRWPAVNLTIQASQANFDEEPRECFPNVFEVGQALQYPFPRSSYNYDLDAPLVFPPLPKDGKDAQLPHIELTVTSDTSSHGAAERPATTLYDFATFETHGATVLYDAIPHTPGRFTLDLVAYDYDGIDSKVCTTCLSVTDMYRPHQTKRPAATSQAKEHFTLANLELLQPQVHDLVTFRHTADNNLCSDVRCDDVSLTFTSFFGVASDKVDSSLTPVADMPHGWLDCLSQTLTGSEWQTITSTVFRVSVDTPSVHTCTRQCAYTVALKEYYTPFSCGADYSNQATDRRVCDGAPTEAIAVTQSITALPLDLVEGVNVHLKENPTKAPIANPDVVFSKYAKPSDTSLELHFDPNCDTHDAEFATKLKANPAVEALFAGHTQAPIVFWRVKNTLSGAWFELVDGDFTDPAFGFTFPTFQSTLYFEAYTACGHVGSFQWHVYMHRTESIPMDDWWYSLWDCGASNCNAHDTDFRVCQFSFRTQCDEYLSMLYPSDAASPVDPSSHEAANKCRYKDKDSQWQTCSNGCWWNYADCDTKVDKDACQNLIVHEGHHFAWCSQDGQHEETILVESTTARALVALDQGVLLASDDGMSFTAVNYGTDRSCTVDPAVASLTIDFNACYDFAAVCAFTTVSCKDPYKSVIFEPNPPSWVQATYYPSVGCSPVKNPRLPVPIKSEVIVGQECRSRPDFSYASLNYPPAPPSITFLAANYGPDSTCTHPPISTKKINVNVCYAWQDVCMYEPTGSCSDTTSVASVRHVVTAGATIELRLFSTTTCSGRPVAIPIRGTACLQLHGGAYGSYNYPRDPPRPAAFDLGAYDAASCHGSPTKSKVVDFATCYAFHDVCDYVGGSGGCGAPNIGSVRFATNAKDYGSGVIQTFADPDCTQTATTTAFKPSACTAVGPSFVSLNTGPASPAPAPPAPGRGIILSTFDGSTCTGAPTGSVGHLLTGTCYKVAEVCAYIGGCDDLSIGGARLLYSTVDHHVYLQQFADPNCDFVGSAVASSRGYASTDCRVHGDASHSNTFALAPPRPSSFRLANYGADSTCTSPPLEVKAVGLTTCYAFQDVCAFSHGGCSGIGLGSIKFTSDTWDPTKVVVLEYAAAGCTGTFTQISFDGSACSAASTGVYVAFSPVETRIQWEFHGFRCTWAYNLSEPTKTFWLDTTSLGANQVDVTKEIALKMQNVAVTAVTASCDLMFVNKNRPNDKPVVRTRTKTVRIQNCDHPRWNVAHPFDQGRYIKDQCDKVAWDPIEATRQPAPFQACSGPMVFPKDDTIVGGHTIYLDPATSLTCCNNRASGFTCQQMAKDSAISLCTDSTVAFKYYQGISRLELIVGTYGRELMALASGIVAVAAVMVVVTTRRRDIRVDNSYVEMVN